MPLRLTRSVDSILYGGLSLDAQDLEKTFDHRIWVRRIIDHGRYQNALVNISSDEGVSEHLMKVGDAGIFLADDVKFELVGITNFLKKPDYCEHCGRGHIPKDLWIPQARVAVSAPREYQIIRDDARKKK